MQLSRELRRSFKNSGVSKMLENTFYRTISEIKKGIEPITELKVVSDDKLYDITPILILAMSLIGAKNMDKGYDLVHKHINDHIKDKDYSDERTKIYLIGSNLSTILEKYELEGMYSDIARTLSVAKSCGIYNGNMGDYLLDEYYADEVDDVFDIVPESDRLKDIYLSTVYGVALDVYSLCMLEGESITDEFLALYMLVLALSEDSDIYKFIKVCMTYCILNNKKEDSDFEFFKQVSGNLIDDVKAIDIKFYDIIESLEFDIEEQSYVSDGIGLTDEECAAIELFRVVRISATLDAMYRLFIVQHSKNLRDLKNDGMNAKKELLRGNRSLTKKLTKTESALKSKTKELEKLTNTLKLVKKNSKEAEYKRIIADLEAKLKSAESKNVSANSRIATLEERLKGVSEVKPKPIVTTEEVIKSIGNICELPTLSVEEKLACVKDTKLLVVGGKATWFERLSKYFPNAKHIDIENKGSNYTVPMSTECVIVMTKVVAHKHVSRLETQLSKSVPIIPINVSKISDVVNEMYKELEEKRKGTLKKAY